MTDYLFFSGIKLVVKTKYLLKKIKKARQMAGRAAS
jgi:hypothetical protein